MPLEAGAWSAFCAPCFIASMALLLLGSGAVVVLGIGIGMAVLAADGMLFIALLLTGACAALLAAEATAVAAFWDPVAADDWPALPELLQADSDSAVAEASATASTVRVNFIGDLLEWPWLATKVAGLLERVQTHNTSVREALDI